MCRAWYSGFWSALSLGRNEDGKTVDVPHLLVADFLEVSG